MNKCDRCKRELKNPRAKYGPVCAKIMGVDEKYYTDISKKQNAAFREGVAMAQKNLANPFIDGSKVDYVSYAHSMGNYMAALERGDINEAERYHDLSAKVLNGEPDTSNADAVLKTLLTSSKNSLLNQDITEFGKGSYAYYLINTLNSMYEKETNVYKKEQIGKRIKDVEAKYRSQISDTKLSGVPEFWFDKDNIQGIWTSSINSKQRVLGYSDSYDIGFDIANDMNALKIEFRFEKKTTAWNSGKPIISLIKFKQSNRYLVLLM